MIVKQADSGNSSHSLVKILPSLLFSVLVLLDLFFYSAPLKNACLPLVSNKIDLFLGDRRIVKFRFAWISYGFIIALAL